MLMYIVVMYSWCTAQAAITSSSFTSVYKVSLPDYDDDILVVRRNVCSPIGCSAKCQTNCQSYSYNMDTQECTTYTTKLCGGKSVNQSPVILTYVKERDISAHGLTSCSDLSPSSPSGIYNVTLTPDRSDVIYCDMATAGGPWTVIQNRQHGMVDFFRSWAEYKAGFGGWSGDFWIGLDVIHLLTQTDSILRIEMTSWYNDTKYAQYSDFSVGDESSEYRLSVSGFSGNVPLDAMIVHNGQPFSTYDNDNDNAEGNCAEYDHGAWWYEHCHLSNLNGQRLPDNGDNDKSMTWLKFYSDRDFVPLMKSRMLVKRLCG